MKGQLLGKVVQLRREKPGHRTWLWEGGTFWERLPTWTRGPRGKRGPCQGKRGLAVEGVHTFSGWRTSLPGGVMGVGGREGSVLQVEGDRLWLTPAWEGNVRDGKLRHRVRHYQ